VKTKALVVLTLMPEGGMPVVLTGRADVDTDEVLARGRADDLVRVWKYDVLIKNAENGRVSYP
jgi:hypothetical protein